MRKSFSICIIFLICLNVEGQRSKVDSLLNVLENSKDQEKARIYYELGLTTIWSWPDSTIEYAKKGLEFANRFNQLEQKFDLLFALANAYAERGNFSIGLELAFEELAIAKEMNDPLLVAQANSVIGSVYFFAKQYDAALRYFLIAAKNDAVYQNQKWLYAGFLGETYYMLNELDSAKKYLQISLDNMEPDYKWPPAYLYMGRVFEREGLIENAIIFYKESINSDFNIVPVSDFIRAYLAIAEVFSKMKEPDSAIHYAKLANEYSNRSSLAIHTEEVLSLLKDNYLAKSLLDSAYFYQGLLLDEQERLYSRDKLIQLQNVAYDQEKQEQKLIQEKQDLNRRLTIYSLLAGIIIVMVVVLILYRSVRFKQRANKLLQRQKSNLDRQKSKVEEALEQLQSTQSQLVHSEKMASLGELTAGIAHEIQNPLNFVNNFSEVNSELVEELIGELSKGNIKEAEQIGKEIIENEGKISHHGKRAEQIVKSMLQHSRTSEGQKEPTDINDLCDEYMRLAYHGFRAKDPSFQADFQLDLDPDLPQIEVIPQDIGRVLLNIINNAFQAVAEVDNPIVTLQTQKLTNSLTISIADNGSGIPPDIREKIFQPFFTTKPTGQGTGLGLSLSYDIVTKGHGGTIEVESNESGSVFTINLPV